MAVTAGSAELALLFVLDVLVLLARTSGAMAVGGGIAVAKLLIAQLSKS